MKLTELLAQREQELLAEIESLEKVEITLKECRNELDALRQAQDVVINKTPLLTPATNKAEPDVSDLLLLRDEWEKKFVY